MTERNDGMRDAGEPGEARDAAIEARYRAASNQMPGAAADAAILAQARAAAVQMTARPSPAANDASWSKRLRAPLALAACAVLTVGIVTRIGVENPAGVTAGAPASSPAGAPLSTPLSKPLSTPLSTPNGERVERPAGAASPAPAPASAPVMKSASAHADAAGAAATGAASVARAKAASIEKAADYAVASGSAPARDAQPPVEAARKLREDERKQSAQVASAPPAQAERSLSVAGVREPSASAAKESPAAAPAPAAAPPSPATQAAPARAAARSAAVERGPDVAEMRRDAAPQSADAAPAPAAKPAARAPYGIAPNPAQTNAPATVGNVLAGDASGAASAGGAAAGVMDKREAPALLSAAREALLPPERWLAYLIELRRAGLHAAADASLARLRARYPEQGIPADARGPQAFPDSSK